MEIAKLRGENDELLRMVRLVTLRLNEAEKEMRDAGVAAREARAIARRFSLHVVLQTQDAGARPCAPAADRGIIARPALGNALLAHGRPAIFRPDNGAEYNGESRPRLPCVAQYRHLPLEERPSLGEWVPGEFLRQIQDRPRRFQSASLPSASLSLKSTDRFTTTTMIASDSARRAAGRARGHAGCLKLGVLRNGCGTLRLSH
ncbi:hypothetical protein ABIA00_003312 [Bradyrhizobium ottawaense]